MKRLLALLFFSVSLFFINGCSQDVNPGQAQPAGGKQTETDTKPEPATDKQMDIHLYYADDQALDLLETEEKLVFQEDADKYKLAYLALTKSPNEKMVTLWEENALEQISFNEGTLSFEFKMTESFGSSAERLQVLSLLKTMFQFPEVNQIQIKNQDQESLNGHVDITKPFTREMLADL